MKKRRQSRSSWQGVSKWYDKTVGKDGHYYHREVILPRLLPLLEVKNPQKCCLIDFACGQGILERHISKETGYHGIDVSKDLIRSAKKHSMCPSHTFSVADISKPLKLPQKYTHATILLALQNIENFEGVIQNASRALEKNGRFFIVLNHPCFRIPRQSSWHVQEKSNEQVRQIHRYMTPLEIPIQMHPSKREASEKTFSYHRPLSLYITALAKAGFVVDGMEEWVSNKKSTGGQAKRENRARKEIPLFLTLCARKS